MGGCDVPCIPGDGEIEAKRLKLMKNCLNYFAKFMQLPFILLAVITVYLIKDIFLNAANY